MGVTATDSDGSISNVQFFVNNVLTGTKTNSPYTVTLTNISFGVSTLLAKATDNQGNSSFSAAVGLIVAPDTDGDGRNDFDEILLGWDPTVSDPWTPPGYDPGDHTPPTITLDLPSNATLLP
jgi:hypothetical protein